jgi:hypothetical protein
MTLRRLVLRILALYIGAGFFANTALAQKKYVTTVVAFKAESVPARTDNMLKISADDSDPIQSTSHAVVTFALDNAIPKDAGISRATLRLVGRPATEYIAEQNSQLVKLVAIHHRESFVGQWNARPNESVFTASSESLRQVVAQAVLSGTLSVELTSRSRLSDWNYYGLSDKNLASSFKPRLIVEYGMPQHLENDIQSTTRTSRIFLVGLEGKVKVVEEPFHKEIKFLTNPAFGKGDNVFVIGDPSGDKPYLYDFSTYGAANWSVPVATAPGSHLLMAPWGFTRTSMNIPMLVRGLYSIGKNQIVLYDLIRRGQIAKTVDVKDLVLEIPPTVGADGSLYFVRSGYVYGLNPNLQELWRYPDKEGAGTDAATRITLSPELDRYAYVLTRRGKVDSMVQIDTTNGSATQVALGASFEGFQRPLVVKGPEQDYVVVATYSHDDGNLSVYSGGKPLWQQPGTVSQPVVDQAGELVFAIQNGSLHEYNLMNGAAVCTSAENDLEADSNPVLDARNNLYVWTKGTLVGYRSNCHRFFVQRLDLPQKLELLFTEVGTLFARTGSDQLFSIRQSPD